MPTVLIKTKRARLATQFLPHPVHFFAVNYRLSRLIIGHVYGVLCNRPGGTGAAHLSAIYKKLMMILLFKKIFIVQFLIRFNFETFQAFMQLNISFFFRQFL